MPCPPSLEEQQLTRAELQIATSTAIIARLTPSLAQSLAVTVALRGRHPERDADVPDFAACVEHARNLIDRGFPTYVDPPDAPASPSTLEEAADRAFRVQLFYADVATRLELALCVMGTYVARLIHHLGRPPLTDPLAPAIAGELARHRAHRQEERAHVLDLLTNQLTWREQTGDTAHATELRERIARITAIDDATLCTDRHCF